MAFTPIGNLDTPEFRVALNAKLALLDAEIITVPRIYYVRTDGSDSNTGLADTAGGAFLTINKAIDVVVSKILMNQVEIRVGPGTYSHANQPILRLKAWFGTVVPLITGSVPSPATRILSSTIGSTIEAQKYGVLQQSATYLGGQCNWLLRGFQLNSPGQAAYPMVYVANGAKIELMAVNYAPTGAVPGTHNLVCDGGELVFARAGGVYSIAGTASLYHVQAIRGGIVRFDGPGVVAVTTPSFTAFCYAEGLSRVHNLPGATITFTGTPTGTRHTVAYNAFVSSGSVGVNWFPGSVAGGVSTGGLFV